MRKIEKSMKPVRAAEIMGTVDDLFKTEGLLPVLGCIADAVAVGLCRMQDTETPPLPEAVPRHSQKRNEYFERYDLYVLADHLMHEVTSKLRNHR